MNKFWSDGAGQWPPSIGSPWSLLALIEFDAGKLIQALTALRTFADSFAPDDSRQTPNALPRMNWEQIKEYTVTVIHECERLKLDAATASGRKIWAILETNFRLHPNAQMEDLPGPLVGSEAIAFRTIANLVSELSARVYDELSAKLIFILPSDKSRYFNKESNPFDGDLYSRYPSCGYDIDECLKCLALERPTAAVFHAMRVVEAGIKGLARCLAIPDPTKRADKNWGTTLNIIQKEIDRRWPRSRRLPNTDGALFEEMHTTLDAMKNSWRNTTMHLEKKYTEREAEDVMRATANFMNKICKRCDEQGEPKA